MGGAAETEQQLNCTAQRVLPPYPFYSGRGQAGTKTSLRFDSVRLP
jgi:hypothetical protein